MAMVIRVRSRDGIERLSIANPNPNFTISDLKSVIESQLNIPSSNQTLSLNQNLLLAKTLESRSKFTDMSNPKTLISSLNIRHGSLIYLYYDGDREIVAPKTRITPAGSFGKKMTMDDLIAKQMRVTRQEQSHCEIVSIDRDSANNFQRYVNETLAFSVKRGGFMYGRVDEIGKVEVDFIYEPPQVGKEDRLLLMRDNGEEKIVDAIAMGLGMKKVGYIFTQSVGQEKDNYTMSNFEVLQAVELQAESEMKEWVTAMVKLEVNEEGVPSVHFEAFQMSDMCVRLFKEGWFDLEGLEGNEIDPKVSRMKKDVIVGGKDVREVDNDFFLVLVKIEDHQGMLLSGFPIENRIDPISTQALKAHFERTKSLPFVKRISDFHLLLAVSRHLDLNADVPALTECVHSQSEVPEGYQLLIVSMAGA